MQSKAKTVDQYLASLPADRREVLEAVRAVVLENLSKEYEEGMQCGMIGYYVPHSVYPAGYHCDPKQPLPFASLASQKNHMAIYLMCLYGDAEHEARFRKAWAKTGRKLDMGKSCVRFKKIEDVALEVIGQAIKRVPAKKFIALYESVIKSSGKRPTKTIARKSSAKKTAAKSARKSTGKRTAKAKTASKRSVPRA
ncbi:MAG: DUF1801 domain-containing protein [Planctomycetes bacterium]|nr:DUF1801 domain-containing protein [Planctomycetota bacterium]